MKGVAKKLKKNKRYVKKLKNRENQKKITEKTEP